MSKKSIILVGGGGHCKSVIDVVESTNAFSIEGILDLEEQVGKAVLGYPIIGTNDKIEKLTRSNVTFLITVGQLLSDVLRRQLFERLKSYEASIATIISPLAHVSKYTKIGEGTIVMHHANINAGAVVGANNIINTGSNVEHDVITGDHCHLSTHAVINGGCKLGNGIFIGSNSVLTQCVTVADHVTIGAGTVVHKSILSAGVYAGNPFKKLK